MLNEKFGVNVKYFMSVGEKWITFTIIYNSDILCEFENNFYTFEKGWCWNLYLIVMMGMCEFRVCAVGFLLLPRAQTFHKCNKQEEYKKDYSIFFSVRK